MVFEKLRELIAEQFAVERDSITMDTAFVDDLGADSLDVVELTMAIEEEFDLPEVPDEDLKMLRMVGDVAAYIGRTIAD